MKQEGKDTGKVVNLEDQEETEVAIIATGEKSPEQLAVPTAEPAMYTPIEFVQTATDRIVRMRSMRPIFPSNLHFYHRKYGDIAHMCNEEVEKGVTRQCTIYGEQLRRDNKAVDNRQKLKAQQQAEARGNQQ